MTFIQPAPRSMRTFFVLWFGQMISIIGSGLTSFALGVWIFQKTGAATPFSITVLMGNLPRILVAPLAGAAADRWNRRRIMILTDSLNALVTLGLVLVVAADALQLWMVYLSAAIFSLCSGFQDPAYSASVAMLVPKDQLGRANGFISLAQSLEMLVSPLLAGFLLVAIGFHGVVLIDFLTFFFAVGTLLLVNIPQPAPSGSGRPSLQALWKDMRFGFDWLRGRPGLIGLLVYFAQVNFFLNFAAVLTTPLVLSFGNPATLGAVQVAMGAGMLAGSLLMSVWGGSRRRVLTVVGGICMTGLGFLITASRLSAWVIGAGLFFLMLFIPVASASAAVIFQSRVPPEVQGRVFSIRSLISTSMMPLAFLISGPLADRVFEPLMRPGGGLAGTLLGAWLGTGAGRGIGVMFLLAGLLVIFSSLLAWANPHIRHLESELPEALAAEGPASPEYLSVN